MDPNELGLVNPNTGQAGAVSPEHQGPSDVMEAPAFAATEDQIARIQDAQADQQAQPQGASAAAFLSIPQVQAGAAPAQAGSGQASQMDWDSDQNPYKQRLAQIQPDQVTQARQQLAQLPAYQQQSLDALIQGGYDPAHAQQLVTLATQAARTELERVIERSTTEPLARQMVAQDIAERFSLPGIPVDPKQLANLPSPRAMEQRARQLVTQARNASAQTRVQQRVDTVEQSGSVTGGAAGTAGTLSSFETIKAGLRSQRR